MKNRGKVLLRVCAKLLSPEALSLAQTAPQTVWRLLCVWTLGVGVEGAERGGELKPDFDYDSDFDYLGG